MGFPGLKGDQGPRGFPGPPGNADDFLHRSPEYKGEKGAKGERGDNGIQGQPGEKGTIRYFLEKKHQISHLIKID